MKMPVKRTSVGLMILLAFTLGAGRVWSQTIPDLTQSQTLGVDESLFFYLGPTGMKGWMYWSSLTREARQILVTEVRAGTPADGVMQYHDVILGINGGLFTNDARVAFCDAVNDAEATGNGGELYLTVFRPSLGATNILMVPLEEMGALSPTTPYNCPKVDAVLSNFCEYVYQNGPVGGPTIEPSVWAMMASGVPKYVNWATNWVMSQSWATQTNRNVYRDTGLKVWYTGYQLVTLGQYYLLTSNAAALPAIGDLANFIAQGQDWKGLWGHTMAWPNNNGGQLHGTLPGYGALNQAGLVGLYGLVLAQKCGVNDPEVNAAVDKAAHFFRSHVGLGSINYGYHSPVWSVTDSNGRNGIAAHLFRALGDHEAAKWFAMLTSTYGWRDWGHTGNEFNHCWGPMAANIGGPSLAYFVQGDRSHEPFYSVSLTLRRQPEGWFQSQGQEGRGPGRSNGHATGGYAVQLAGPRAHIEMTGAGYDTNLYWLTAAELEQVRFAHRYEADYAGLAALDTPTLVSNLWNFAPKIAIWSAQALAARVPTDAALVTQLVAIVQDDLAADTARGAALCALGGSNVLVKATTDTWYSPVSNSYVLNWRAAEYGAKDVTTWTNILAAIAQFDPDVGFDMLTAGAYSQAIYSMNTNLLDAAGMELYYDAVAAILRPGTGGGWFISGQNIKNWDPLVLARYADSLLRTAEMYAMDYDSPSILTTAQIGEGLHSWMTRNAYYSPFSPDVSRDPWQGYGRNMLAYSNNLVRLGAEAYGFHNNEYRDIVAPLLQFDAAVTKPPLVWFRSLIATNIDNTLTNPVTKLADLRYQMTVGADDDLFHAACLDQIVKHPANPDPFVDITNALGSTVPVPSTHWRLYAAAVELGVADTNANTRWLAALSNELASTDRRVLTGILHVLGGRGVTQALATAASLLDDDDDYLAAAALDVFKTCATTNELVMLYTSFLTNCSEWVDDSFIFDSPYKQHGYWDAITNIVARDPAGSFSLANQLAAAYRAHTNAFGLNSGSATSAFHRMPYRGTGLPIARQLSILNPDTAQAADVLWERDRGPLAVLGLFPGTDCQTALAETPKTYGSFDNWYGQGQGYCASEASLVRFSHQDIVNIQNGAGTNLWDDRGAMMYLYFELIKERVPVSNQLAVLTHAPGATTPAHPHFNPSRKSMQDGYGLFYDMYQRELTYRRGLEETDGAHFFYIK